MNKGFAQSIARIAFAIAAFIAPVSALSESAMAAIVVTAQEVGGNVVFQGGGAIDASALTLGEPRHGDSAGINANFGLRFQPPGRQTFNLFTGVITPLPSFGNPASPFFTPADSSSGDVISIFRATDSSPDILILTSDYVSGAPLSGTMTFNNASLDTLGLFRGEYVASWATLSGIDTWTLHIIPEPAGLTLVLESVLPLLLMRFRRIGIARAAAIG